MNLYEARNGMVGSSYVRCYIWVCCEARALTLASIAFAAELVPKGPEYHITVEFLFASDQYHCFCTKVSSEGWEV